MSTLMSSDVLMMPAEPSAPATPPVEPVGVPNLETLAGPTARDLVQDHLAEIISSA